MSDIEEECLPAAAAIVKHKNPPPSAMAAVGAEGSIDDQLNLDPEIIGQATNDLDLDQVNDNLQDYDDNTSLEVNFGDGSSCRVSDVSSLSFQNMVLDDIDGENIDSETVEASGSRRDSVDSSDSIPNDYPGEEDSERFRGSLEEEIRRKVKLREKDPDRSLDCSDDDSYIHRKACSDDMSMDEESDTGTMKKRREKQLLSGGDDYIEEERFPSPHQQPATQSVCDSTGQQSGNNTSLDQMLAKHIREMDPGHTQVSDLGTSVGVNPLVSNSGPSDMQNPSKKRNSLEIRNNIPNVNEVKIYEGDANLDLSRFQNSGAVPKIKKKSPGLARRLTGSPTNDRDTSSSEKEMENQSQRQSNPPPTVQEVSPTIEAAETQHHNGNVTASRNKTTKETKVEGIPHPFTITSDGMIRQESPMDTSIEKKIQITQGLDIENEYDYVKYARIQQGDSYVGMRLAYSSSSDSLSYRANNGVGPQGLDHNDFLGSSRETSPEKSLHHPQHHPQHRSFSEQLQRLANVNEDSLTEIPLNGSELGQDEHKNFTLSPEATECDSAEVESVISEETEDDGKTMPAVEDGLSSSQGSDTEDTSTMDIQRPSEMLKHRHRADRGPEIDTDMLSNQSPAEDYRSGHSKDSGSSSHQSTLSRPESCDMSKEAVDLAIRDIKSAIEQSKSLMLKPQDDEKGNGEEPVWVMRNYNRRTPGSSRDNYVQKLQRQEEMRKVREEIERQQEEE